MTAKKKTVKETFTRVNRRKPAKKADPGVLIVLLVDESGSMSHLRDETVTSLNKFIEEQKDVPGKASIIVNTFDAGSNRPIVRTILPETPIKKAVGLSVENYRPSGMTPLFDAFGMTIEQIKPLVKNRRVLFVVMTDGHENTSKEWNLSKLKNEVENLKWQFVFMGAGIDAWGESMAIGGHVLASNSLSYDNTVRGWAGATDKLVSSTRMYRAAATGQCMNFFDPNNQISLDAQGDSCKTTS